MKRSKPPVTDPVIDITLSSDESVIAISSDESDGNEMDIGESVATISGLYANSEREIGLFVVSL